MWWGALAFGLVLAWQLPNLGSPLAVWVAAAAGLAAYLIDVRLHPWTRCWWCVLVEFFGFRRDSKIRDAAGTSWGYCRACGGSGRRRRMFAGGED